MEDSGSVQIKLTADRALQRAILFGGIWQNELLKRTNLLLEITKPEFSKSHIRLCWRVGKSSKEIEVTLLEFQYDSTYPSHGAARYYPEPGENYFLVSTQTFRRRCREKGFGYLVITFKAV